MAAFYRGATRSALSKIALILFAGLLAACGPPRPPNTRIPDTPAAQVPTDASTATSTIPAATATVAIPTATTEPAATLEPTATFEPTATLEPAATATFAPTLPPTATATLVPTLAPTATPLPTATATVAPPAGRILFYSDAGGALNLWQVQADCVLSADGCTPEPVTNTVGGIVPAIPHPSSATLLAYLGPAPVVEVPPGVRSINRTELFAACLTQPGACDRVLLTPDEAAFYVLHYPDEEYTHDLWRVDIATGGTMPLYIQPGPPTLHDAYWIPTGSLITEWDDFNRIIVAQQDPEPYTPTRAIACAGYAEPGRAVGAERVWMSWSPDGTRVAAACRVTQDTPAGPAYLVGAALHAYDLEDGRALIPLRDPVPATRLDMSPYWMPDGATIVFVRAQIAQAADETAPPDSPVTLGPRQLWYHNVDTGNQGPLLVGGERQRDYALLGWVDDRLLVRETPYTEETLPGDDMFAWDAVLNRDDDATYWLLTPTTLDLEPIEPPEDMAAASPGASPATGRDAPAPDGRWTAVSRDGALWLVDAGGQRYLLAERGTWPVWAP